jgi:glycerate-2-kinase
VDGYRELRARAPDRVAAIRATAERLEGAFRTAGIDPTHVSARYFSAGAVAHGLLGFLGRLLLFFPLALPGIALHAPAYLTIDALATRIARGHDDVLATAKIIGGAVLYPLTWAATALVVGFRLGWQWGLLAAAVAPLSGYAAVRLRERLERFLSLTRALGFYLFEPESFGRLAAERDRLRDELLALAGSLSASDRLRDDAVAIYRAGVDAVEPARALGRALATTPPPEDRVWVIALGKAARAMARAAVEHLRLLDVQVAGGLVVTTSGEPPIEAGLPVLAGDHPLPGADSSAAAAGLGQVVAGVTPHDEVWVLLSGGTSSLVGAPIEEVSAGEFAELHRLVARVGLPIARLNAVRKRFARWGGGRLLQALRSERVRVFALSDVPSDDPADIGSGPCEPDVYRAAEVRRILQEGALWEAAPPAARRYLEGVERGDLPETLKPGEPSVARRSTRVIGGNRAAVAAAADRARTLGYAVVVLPDPLAGEAAEVGVRLARALLADLPRAGRRALIAGGETTVSLGPSPGRGGRCQELALAAAAELAGRRPGAVLLAAGTDGRDGPTDAAGAVVGPDSWGAIARAGLDPAAALAGHDAYPALDRAGALLRLGPTGTNVMDLVIGLASRPGERG